MNMNNVKNGKMFVMAAALGLLISISVGTMIKMNQGKAVGSNAVNKAAVTKAAGKTNPNVWVEAKDYKDWRFECRGLTGKKQGNCSMYQNIAWDNSQRRALTVAINYVPVKNKDGKLLAVPRMSIIAPLGVRIPYGLITKLGDSKENKFQFAMCRPIGCVAEVGFGKEFLDQMKSGGAMGVTFMRADGKLGNVSVSLDGFGDAFNALTSKAKEEANGKG